MALALKPNARVVLMTQDKTYAGNFDIPATRCVDCTEDNLVQNLISEFKKAADAFEADRYVRLIATQLTVDAIVILNRYAKLRVSRATPEEQPAILGENAAFMVRDRFFELAPALPPLDPSLPSAFREFSAPFPA